MRYAIVESGGKQYKAVEGELIEVDRLPNEEGAQIGLERILLMADGADFMIGTPTLSGIKVRATIVDHFSGRKVTHFKYSPKKRIRVRGGHRQLYTRLMVDFIGSEGETRSIAKPDVKAERAESQAKTPAKKQGEPSPKEAPKKAAAKTTTARKPAVAGKASGGSATKKPNK
jgi:large subunit ribosomal protein L21